MVLEDLGFQSGCVRGSLISIESVLEKLSSQRGSLLSKRISPLSLSFLFYLLLFYYFYFYFFIFIFYSHFSGILHCSDVARLGRGDVQGSA